MNIRQVYQRQVSHKNCYKYITDKTSSKHCYHDTVLFHETGLIGRPSEKQADNYDVIKTANQIFDHSNCMTKCQKEGSKHDSVNTNSTYTRVPPSHKTCSFSFTLIIETSVWYMQLTLASMSDKGTEHNSHRFFSTACSPIQLVRMPAFAYMTLCSSMVYCSSECREMSEIPVTMLSEESFKICTIRVQFVSRHIFGYILNTACFTQDK